MNTALLLSGGRGLRLGSEVPKQYIEVSRKMILTYSLETLTKSAQIDQICIVAEEEWRDAILSDAQKHGLDMGRMIGFADPGANRQESILHGLQSIYKWLDREDTMRHSVLIHDAARPNLSQKQIEECFRALGRHDGVMPALPMKDTVYFCSDGCHISQLLDRSKIFAGQAPELFDLQKYYEANLSLLPDRILSINGSTEPAVLAGMDMVVIEGDERNFKITTSSDLERFRKMMDTVIKKSSGK